ncbi:hypothetical protein OROGR_016586 [Orobanche gracilis]
MKKTQSTIHVFFTRKYVVSSSQDAEETTNLNDNIPPCNVSVTENPSKKAQVNSNDIDLSLLERDPGLRHQVYDYPVNQQDTIRRAYMNLGPLQPSLYVFPKSGSETHKHGFRNWKKVGGKKCVLLMHMGNECTSFHNIAQRGWDNILNEVQDIRNVFEKFTTEEREKNRLRLSTSIFSVRWCAFQAVAFRDHNENPNSINKGNFLEMLEALGEFSTELKELFCRAPKYASYTSPMIQKEILNIISNKVRRVICEEIGGGRFCLLVDEALDQSHKEQMSVVLRF